MMELNYKILVVLFFLPLCSYSQLVFYCEFENSSSSDRFHSKCSYFYNYTKSTKDSIISLNEISSSSDETLLKEILMTGMIKEDTMELEYSISDQIILKGKLVNGLAEGFFLFSYEGDTTICEYQGGKLNGERISKSMNGLYRVENFKNGILDGFVYELGLNGQKTYSALFRNGKKHGPEYELYEDGSLSSFLLYKNGNLVDGKYYKFDSDGNIVYELNVKGGKESTHYVD